MRHTHYILAGAAALALSPVIQATAAESSEGVQQVQANVAPTLELTVPADYYFGFLSVGDNESPAQDLFVQSNRPYSILVRGDRANMAHWLTGPGMYLPAAQCANCNRPGPGILLTPMEWKPEAGAYANISTQDVGIDSGLPSTGSVGATTRVRYRQEALFSDYTLNWNCCRYNIILTFTASQDI